MDFEYIKEYYKVKADMFREVIINDKKGVILSDLGNYIGVLIYGDKNILPYHPTDQVTYLDSFNYKPISKNKLKAKERYKHFLSLDLNMGFFEYLKSEYCI